MPAPILILALGAAVLAFLTTSKEGDVKLTLDTLTDSFTRLEAWAKGQSLGLIDVVDIGGEKFLRKDAAYSFMRMSERAQGVGVALKVNSAFRSMEEQTALYQQHLEGTLTTPVARPGWSNHQNGIAVDIEVSRSTLSIPYLWLNSNGGDHGWVNVGKTYSTPEYWHWEYQPEKDRYA